jgi:[protein-PII] uridylyltransferase
MSIAAVNPGNESIEKQKDECSHVSQTFRHSLHSWMKWHLPAGVDAEEMEAHFRGMPAHYWERVTESELSWGLETIHKFLHLVSEVNSSAVAPVLDWRHMPEDRWTKVMICTWDRHGLLAKAAAAFSAVGINILQADVFTRADNIVLDVFRVCEARPNTPIVPERLKEMLFLLEGALSEPPRFASIWASLGHKVLPHGFRQRASAVFDNSSSREHSILRVEALDRIGLLCDILSALADCNLNIDQAVIDTAGETARDLFYLRDANKKKITEPDRLEFVRNQVLEAINA